MLFYGIGTMPAMIMFGIFGAGISLRFRQLLRQASTVFTIIGNFSLISCPEYRHEKLVVKVATLLFITLISYLENSPSQIVSYV